MTVVFLDEPSPFSSATSREEILDFFMPNSSGRYHIIRDLLVRTCAVYSLGGDPVMTPMVLLLLTILDRHMVTDLSLSFCIHSNGTHDSSLDTCKSN